jgi:hypothetical protein
MNTQDCSTSGDSCCSILSSSIHKLAFETSYSCIRQIVNATINGGHLNFDVSGRCTVLLLLRLP